MKLFKSFDHLLSERKLICEGDAPVMWPSDPPSDPEERRQLVKKVKLTVEKARFQIATRDMPTVGIFLQNLRMVFTYDVKTMAVDNKNNLYMNPTFTDFMSFNEVKGVLIHEAMHIFTGTFYRQSGRNMRLWNICTDYLMNYYIVKDGFSLPKGGCIPDSKGNVIFRDFTGVEHTFNIINKTAEWLYAQLDKLPKPPPESGDTGDGDPGDGDPVPVDENGIPLQPTDDDSPPENVTPEEGSKEPNTTVRDLRDIHNDIRTAIRTAKQKEHQGGSGRGEGVGNGLDDLMLDSIKSRTNYKQLLRNLVQNVNVRYNWKKSSKRGLAVGSWIPKMVTDRKLAKVTVAIDTSGSVGDEMIKQIIGECIKIAQQFPGVSLEIVKWDIQVYYHQIIDSGTRDVKSVINSHIRRGGTTMSSVADFYNKNKELKQPAAVLYFTDGGVETTPRLLPSPTKNFFLIVQGGSDIPLKNDKRGTTYNIEV